MSLFLLILSTAVSFCRKIPRYSTWSLCSVLVALTILRSHLFSTVTIFLSSFIHRYTSIHSRTLTLAQKTLRKVWLWFGKRLGLHIFIKVVIYAGHIDVATCRASPVTACHQSATVSEPWRLQRSVTWYYYGSLEGTREKKIPVSRAHELVTRAHEIYLVRTS